MGHKNIIYTIFPEKIYHPLPAWCQVGDDLASELNIHLDVIEAYAFQIEEGEETHHPHIQLFIRFQKETRPDRLLRLIGLESSQCHWEQQRFGTAEDMYDYCAKVSLT